MIEGGGKGMAIDVTVDQQSGYVALGTGGFYSALFDKFSIYEGKKTLFFSATNSSCVCVLLPAS